MRLGEVFYEENEGCITEGTTKFLNPFRKPILEDYKQQEELRILIESAKISLFPQSVNISTEHFTLLQN